MWIRCGFCRQYNNTFTILPDWLVPFGHYSLRCRQQACERIAAGESAEQATLHCKDPALLPDPSTLRRWVQRRVFSLWFWARIAAAAEYIFLQHPPSLPGICAPSALCSGSRQKVRESQGTGRVEAADFVAGVFAGPGLAAGAST